MTTPDQLTAPNVTFAGATEVTANFVNPNEPMDGILGLAFSGASSAQVQETFIDALYHAGVIDQRVFSFYLAPKGYDWANTGSSRLIVGPPDMDLIRVHGTTQAAPTPAPPPSPATPNHQPAVKPEVAVFAHADVIQTETGPAMWFVKLDKMTLNSGGNGDNVLLDMCGVFSTPCVVLPDSGTSFLALPVELFVNVIATITKGRSDCFMDLLHNVFCPEGTHGLPTLSFVLGGHVFNLSPSQYMIDDRQLAFQVLNLGFPDAHLLVLGDVFLRAVYTVFDMDKKQIHFAYMTKTSGPSTVMMILPCVCAFLAILFAVHCLRLHCTTFRTTRNGYVQIPE